MHFRAPGRVQSALRLVRLGVAFTGGYKLTEDQVTAEIEKLAPVKLIEFTGGEPMLQERELVPLMERLLRGGYELIIGTSGERRWSRAARCIRSWM